MANRLRTKVLLSLGVASLVAFCSGCATHRWYEGAGPVLAGADAPGASLCDPYYAPPCSELCPIDPVCFGYHPTCWIPWSECCPGCPPPASVVECPLGPAGEGVVGERPFASPGSLFDQIQPPPPPVPEVIELEMAPPSGADTPSPAPKTEREPTPFLEEAPQEEAVPEEDQTRPSLEKQGRAVVAPNPSLAEADESLEEARPDRDLAPLPAITVDAGPTGDREEDSTGSQESAPPAPLPDDLSMFAFTAATAETELAAAVPAERSAETYEDEVEAWANQTERGPEALPELLTPVVAKAPSEALPLASAAARTEGLDDPSGWVFCSDDQGADAVESSRQTESVRSARSGNTDALSYLFHSLLR